LALATSASSESRLTMVDSQSWRDISSVAFAWFDIRRLALRWPRGIAFANRQRAVGGQLLHAF
jgi:hypothetical protein